MSNLSTIDPSRLNCGSNPTENCTTCKFRYIGEYCEIDTLEESVIVEILLVVYQVVCLLKLVYTVSICGYGFYRKAMKEGNRAWISLANIAAYFAFGSSVIESIAMVDPFSMYLILDYYLYYVLIFVGIYLEINCVILTVASWCNLVSSLNKVSDKYDMKVPIIITSVSAGLAVLIILANIVYGFATGDWETVILVFNMSVMVYCVFIISIIFFYLPVIIDITKLVKKTGAKAYLEAVLFVNFSNQTDEYQFYDHHYHTDHRYCSVGDWTIYLHIIPRRKLHKAYRLFNHSDTVPLY
eukprot:TRINITY_DN287_c0_g1_i2.p1 TRINITY_DN287_c0_g1~~TRINITY_DN287_c0_g1_i2.p1  ORF type:complete len:319 (+),score=33.09 TRINITY_DN287_c0_g1_i2:67-957(+)